MAIIDSSFSVTSQLLLPALSRLANCKSSRNCPVISDSDWISLGVERCLDSYKSGRHFIQSFSSIMEDLCPAVTHFFEALKSPRRLASLSELNALIAQDANKVLPDRLACFPCLDGFEIFASDAHFHEHACHDRHPNGKVYAVPHLYSRNLRNGLISHLALCDQIERKKEHDMRALKRTTIEALRQGAPTGRKVLHVYDRAGIDFDQWQRWKQGSGIYWLSRSKTNMSLQKCGDLPFDRADPINAGVIADELVGPSGSGVAIRRVTFHDIHSGRTFEYLTNLVDTKIPPGVIAQLYKMRWDIEKSFDEVKNKLGETKAWATGTNAKRMQAQFICLTLNLVTLMAEHMKQEDDITNRPEDQRRAERTEKALLVEKKAERPPLPPWQMAQAATQHSVKLYRWIAARMWIPILWIDACEALRRLYARL